MDSEPLAAITKKKNKNDEEAKKRKNATQNPSKENWVFVCI